MRNSVWFLNRRNIGINKEINFNYVNLGLLLLFLCNLDSDLAYICPPNRL